MDSSLPPILERIGVAPAFWRKMIENDDRWLHGTGLLRAASASG